MTSQMAMDDIRQLKKQGVDVDPEDVVRLNALGLKITEDPDCELAALPRVATIEGVMFRQPSVAKDILLDDMFRLFNKDESTRLCYEAYVLSHEVDDAVLNHPTLFALKVARWMRKHFKKTQAAHIRRVLDFCLYGVDQTTNEFPAMLYDDKDKDEDRLGGPKSWALNNYLTACALGIESEVALRALSPQLACMIERAYMLKGAKLSKRDKIATADYFKTLDEIKRRYNKD